MDYGEPHLVKNGSDEGGRLHRRRAVEGQPRASRRDRDVRLLDGRLYERSCRDGLWLCSARAIRARSRHRRRHHRHRPHHPRHHRRRRHCRPIRRRRAATTTISTITAAAAAVVAAAAAPADVRPERRRARDLFWRSARRRPRRASPTSRTRATAQRLQYCDCVYINRTFPNATQTIDEITDHEMIVAAVSFGLAVLSLVLGVAYLACFVVWPQSLWHYPLSLALDLPVRPRGDDPVPRRRLEAAHVRRR